MNATSSDIDEFLSYVSSERALSANTHIAYEQDLRQYHIFCERKRLAPAHVTIRQLREYLASLRKQELSARSIARKLSAIKQFYKFLLRENKIQADPSELLSISLDARRLPKALSLEEIVRLIEAPKGENENEVRDRALMELWYATGGRVSEMASLTIQAIDWTDGVVKFCGKGGRERILPVTQTSLEWCQRYRDVRHRWLQQHCLKETSIFFLTRMGKKFTRQGIWKVVKKYAKRAGITKRVWPHMIRHTFATHILQGGADLRAVQELLGHRSISTTEIYTHLDIENLKVMQLKYHPRS